MCDREICLGGCYHSGCAWGIGYYAHGKTIELLDNIFTTFNSGFNGGVVAELKKIHAKFNPLRDVPKFAVALKPVRIVKLDDEEVWTDNARCDKCGCCDRADGKLCRVEKDLRYCDDCLRYGINPETRDCWDYDDEDDRYDSAISIIDDDCCPGCGNYQYCDCDEFDVEFVADTFRSMNAFARARWLKTRGEL